MKTELAAKVMACFDTPRGRRFDSLLSRSDSRLIEKQTSWPVSTQAEATEGPGLIRRTYRYHEVETNNVEH